MKCAVTVSIFLDHMKKNFWDAWAFPAIKGILFKLPSVGFSRFSLFGCRVQDLSCVSLVPVLEMDISPWSPGSPSWRMGSETKTGALLLSALFSECGYCMLIGLNTYITLSMSVSTYWHLHLSVQIQHHDYTLTSSNSKSIPQGFKCFLSLLAYMQQPLLA